jgi:hypothetical protein
MQVSAPLLVLYDLSMHMVGVKICLCFDSQAFPQKHKKHMF